MRRAAAVAAALSWGLLKLQYLALTGLSCADAHPMYPSWMGDNWEQLRSRTLLEITLPGSHNSGNYVGGLSADRLCTSDYRYQDYLSDPSSKGATTPLPKEEFDKLFIPWNVNHERPIREQLTFDGVRFFHLKICDFGAPAPSSAGGGAPGASAASAAAPTDLRGVAFQHRGYTTRETLSGTLDDMLEFLAANPREVLVLGFNNLHNPQGGGFGTAGVLALSDALVEKLGAGMLVTKEELFRSTLEELHRAGRRFAIFMGGDTQVAAAMPTGIIPSVEALWEGWGAAMDSGDFDASRDWLVRDMRSAATKRDRFYVLQANPNDNEAKMFARLNQRGEPASLELWEAAFLEDLEAFVCTEVTANPEVRINAVSTDFLSRSRPLQIAFRIMGLPLPVKGAK